MAALASIDLLRNVPIFAGLAERHLDALVAACRLSSLPAGAVIVSSTSAMAVWGRRSTSWERARTSASRCSTEPPRRSRC
jgi:hypothetical protein